MSSLVVSEELIAETARKCHDTTVNKTKLLDFGYTPQVFQKFDADIEAAKSLKTYEKMQQELKTFTDEMVIKREAVYSWVTRAKYFIDLASEDNPLMLRVFPEDYTKWRTNESLMLRRVQEVFGLLVQFAASLAAKNLPADFATVGTDLVQQLADANQAQENKKESNKEYTQLRYKSFKALYNMVNRINEAGRKAYKNDPENLVAFDPPWPGGKDGDEDDAPDEPTPPAP